MRHKIIFGLILTANAINLISFKSGHDWGDDFAAYIIQSQTIVQNSFETLQIHSLATDYILKYPWGFPILLSPVISFFENQFIILKIFNYFFFIGSLALTFLLFKSKSEVALLTLLLLSLNPFIWEFKNSILSDFPNMFFSLLSILIMKRSYIDKKPVINDFITNLLIGLTIYLCFFIRSQSIVLLITLFIVQLWVFRSSLLQLKVISLNTLPYLVFLLLKFSTENIFELKTSSYIDSNSFSVISILNTVIENVFYYINIWSHLFKDIAVISYFYQLFTGLAFLVVLLGLIYQAKKNYIYIIFSILTIAILLVWPYQQGLRFVLPLFPLVFYFLVVGIYIIANQFLKNIKIFYLSVLMLAFLSFKTIVTFSYLNYKSAEVIEGPYSKSSQEMFTFIRAKTSMDSIIGFFKPRAMLLYGSRDSVVLTTLSDCLEKNVDYFLYYKNGYDQLSLAAIKNHPLTFSPVFSNKSFILYQINR